MITSPITRPITSRIASAIAGARVGGGSGPSTPEELFDTGAVLFTMAGQSLALGSTGTEDVAAVVSSETDKALMFNGGTRPAVDDTDTATISLASTNVNAAKAVSLSYLQESVSPREDKNYAETYLTGISAQNPSVPLFMVPNAVGASTLENNNYGMSSGANGEIFASMILLLQQAKKIYDERGIDVSWKYHLIAQGEANAYDTAADYKAELISYMANLEKYGFASLGDISTPPKYIQYLTKYGGFTTYGPPTAMLELMEEYSNYFVVGPNYHMEDVGDGVHLTSLSYRRYGELIGKVVSKLEQDVAWKPLYITGAVRDGTTITLTYHNPSNTALAFDTTLVSSQANYGFDYLEAVPGDNPITSVTIIDNTTIELEITSAADGCVLYAIDTDGIFGKGNLRDSDTAVATHDSYPLYNWACNQVVQL